MSATLKRDLRTGRSVWATGHGLNVPVRHLSHADAADCDWNEPLAHGRHCCRPVALANVPGTHDTHAA